MTLWADIIGHYNSRQSDQRGLSRMRSTHARAQVAPATRCEAANIDKNCRLPFPSRSSSLGTCGGVCVTFKPRYLCVCARKSVEVCVCTEELVRQVVSCLLRLSQLAPWMPKQHLCVCVSYTCSGHSQRMCVCM